MSPSPSDPRRLIIVIGVPQQLQRPLERAAGPGATVRGFREKRLPKGRFGLEAHRTAVGQTLDQWTLQHGNYGTITCIVLPYAQVPAAVVENVDLLAEMGVEVIKARAGSEGWPPNPPGGKRDQRFLGHLQASIERALFGDNKGPTYDVELSILRGLASHSKLGPNNHSHEDDFWKSRGAKLNSREKNAIESKLLAAGIVDRKKNKSAGGTGWVYWIADVATACRTYPELRSLLDDS